MTDEQRAFFEYGRAVGEVCTNKYFYNAMHDDGLLGFGWDECSLKEGMIANVLELARRAQEWRNRSCKTCAWFRPEEMTSACYAGPHCAYCTRINDFDHWTPRAEEATNRKGSDE